MDVQFCVSMWDTVNYIISYATKKEKEVCQALKDVIGNISLPENSRSRDILRSMGNAFLNARSISQQESIFRALPSIIQTKFV